MCVEPMPGTVKLLQSARASLNYNFSIIAAAAGAESNRTVMFSDSKPGSEMASIMPNARGAGYVRVPMKTVDEIVAELRFPRVDILLIDAEGWDPEVLKGSAKALETVRYLEFEVHRDLRNRPWSRTRLQTLIEELHSRSLACFWSGNDGNLRHLGKCWQPDWEGAGWSNVVCFRTTDVWSQVIPKHTRPITCG